MYLSDVSGKVTARAHAREGRKEKKIPELVQLTWLWHPGSDNERILNCPDSV